MNRAGGKSSGHRKPKPQATIMEKIDVEALVSENTHSLTSAAPSTTVRNVVIFGDSGVGKSSLINMLAGDKIAKTSSSVLGCTFQSSRYTIPIEGVELNIWDTAGLDEGTRGRVTPEVAEKRLIDLLRALRGANGVHLLVYCIRGPTVRKSLARNYTIFYSAICRKKVPIVAVVTGLENEQPNMDDWWITGEKELAKYKMRFDAHACVTTMDTGRFTGTIFEDRSRFSQQAVRELVMNNCRRMAIRTISDPDALIKAALHDFRAMMKSGWDNMGPASTVVFSQTDIFLFHEGIFGDLRRIISQINGRSFVFQFAGDLSGRYITTKLSKGSADLLIFTGKMSNSNLLNFRDFYASCKGEVCPLLIVTDSYSVDAWTRYIDEQGIGGRVEAFWEGRTPADLLGVIDELCLVRGTVKSTKNKVLQWFKRGSRDSPGEIACPT